MGNVSTFTYNGGFKWISIKPSKISQLAKSKSKGYHLEVDAKYPKELHDSSNDLPFMCEQMKINALRIDSQLVWQKEIRHPH